MATGLIVGFFTLAGAVAGSLITHWFQMQRETEQQRKEHGRWVRDEKKRVYVSLLDALGRAEDSIAKEGHVTGDVVWETKKYFMHLRLFGGKKALQDVLGTARDEFGKAKSDEEIGEAVGGIISKVLSAAREDLGIDLGVKN